MNKLLMTACLLTLTGVSAQTIPVMPPGQPAPAQTAPAPSTAAPVAPLQTPSAQTAPSTAPTSTVLLVSAPVGSSAELSTTTSTRMLISDVQVTAAPGSKVSEAKLNQMRREITQGLGRTRNIPVTTTDGKVVVQVTNRDAAGRVTLVTTVQQAMPTPPSAQASKAPQSVSIKVTQVLSPTGKAESLKVESDNPQLNSLFQSLSSDKLRSVLDQQGNDFSGGYGTPLVLGQPRTTKTTIDAQNLLQGLLTSVAGPQGQQVFGKVQATPMTVTTTTTYRGTDAQGRSILDSVGSYGHWRVSMNSAPGAKTPMQLRLELEDVKANATALYRPDGLPGGLNQNTEMKMKLTMTTEGVQVSMKMNLSQMMKMQPR